MLRKLECLKHAIVVGDVTPSVAHLRIRASAPSSLLSRFPVSVASANAISQETFCRLRHVSVQLDCNSLHMCLLSASCHPVQSLFCWSCADSSTHLRWLKTSSWRKKTRCKERIVRETAHTSRTTKSNTQTIMISHEFQHCEYASGNRE